MQGINAEPLTIQGTSIRMCWWRVLTTLHLLKCPVYRHLQRLGEGYLAHGFAIFLSQSSKLSFIYSYLGFPSAKVWKRKAVSNILCLFPRRFRMDWEKYRVTWEKAWEKWRESWGIITEVSQIGKLKPYALWLNIHLKGCWL